MSFRPKQNNIHLTMEDVKGIVLAKDEMKNLQTLADEQILKEAERRGLKVTSQSK
jgi:hypothetical protein